MADYVLVHGAAHGAWCWERMLPYLKHGRGVGRVLAIDLVGHGARVNERPHDQITREDYIRDVAQAIEGDDLEDVVLVGHSNAGTIIPQAATRVANRMKRLVFVSAMIPPEGKTAQQTLADLRHSPTRPGLSLEENYRRMFCNDMDEATANWVMGRIGPEPMPALAEPVRRPGFPAKMPMTYVVLTNDATLPPDIQRKLARNIGTPETVELAAGHDAMVTRPNELAQILLRYA